MAKIGPVSKYIPLNIGIAIRASASDLHSFRWKTGKRVEADFFIDDPRHLLRVSFDGPCIVRLIDEMPLSTEHEHSADEGLVRDHFAYQVEEAAFNKSQSEIWKMAVGVYGPTSHFRFVTGWTCMDVVTPATPEFEIVPRAIAQEA
ncbi:hypothetical protein [Rhizobium leguminosarum]|uniref:Uncharacterized protein n=1 Tax=Rhizobium leguminosarum TaxID=384 RepID=A0A2K9YYM2_RHILE|nr:hypothetical protein [Rhizobium leguminosarum]AUW41050.1 hypothetical protein CUJ84_Chr000643 [Rhizobium leguminosarum]